MDQLFNNEQVEYEDPADNIVDNEEEIKPEEGTENQPMPEEKRTFKSVWNGFWHCSKKDNPAVYYVKEAIEYVLIVVAAFVIATLVNMYVFRLSGVQGSSMNYSYHDGQMVWLTKLPFVFGEPERGDVVILDRHGFQIDPVTLAEAPEYKTSFFKEFGDSMKTNAIISWFFSEEQLKEDQEKFYIKRVIAVAGDTIEFKENAVWVNGEKLNETEYVNPEELPDYGNWEGQSWTIKEGYVFVMGDNRNHSGDSRYYGQCSVKSLLGKVMVKGKTNN